ncbi:hypothetical protein JCM8097_009113 [Rhodosporidiobolus ruineniae]
MVSIKYLLTRNDRLEKRRGASAGGGGRGGGGSVSSGGGRSSGGSSSSGSSSSGRTSGSSGGTSSGSGSGSRSGSSPPPYSPGGPPPAYSAGGSRSVPTTSTPGFSASSGRSILGGGSPRTIAAGAPFAGRAFGGGQRSNIYAGRGYGGGYGRYAVGGAAAGVGFGYVAGLGFPYGYWPLYIGPHYYGGDEYGRYGNYSRPGGALAVASFSSPSQSAQDPPQFLLYGDRSSVDEALSALTSDCSAVTVVGSTAVSDNGTYASNPSSSSNSSAVLLPSLDPTYVQSYYRSSSFALYSFFADSANTDPAVLANFTLPAGQDTARTFLYPASAHNSTFEQCVNGTIGDALPIEEGSYAAEDSNAAGALRSSQGAVVGAVALAAVLLGGGAARYHTLLVFFVVVVALSQASQA